MTPTKSKHAIRSDGQPWPLAEQAVLAAAVADPALRQTILAAGDDVWTHPTSHRVLAAFRQLLDAGHPVDWASVETATGVTWTAAPDAAYWPVLLEQRLGRRLQALGRWLATPRDQVSPSSIAAVAWQKLQQALADADPPQTLSGGDAVHTGLTQIQQGPPQWLRSGIPTLDAAAAWWGPGDVVLLGARPSQGKTALGVQWATMTAAQGRGVAIVTVEMAPEALGLRALSQLTGYSRDQLTRAGRDPHVQQALAQLAAWPWHIIDGSGATVGQLTAAVAQVDAQHGRCDVVVIDYLQLLMPAMRDAAREQEVARISRELKRWARRDHRLIVALAQLRRAVDQRPGARPTLSDLRESGALEQDADGVILIHHDPEDPTQAELLCVKNRNGPVGSIPVAWDGPTMRFGPR